MNWDYIAGFFDGEGSIFISKNKRSIILSIYNINENVLKEIKEFLMIEFQKIQNNLYIKSEGNFSIYMARARKNRSALYNLTIRSRIEVVFFLRNIKDKAFMRNKSIDYLLTNYDFSFKSKKNENFNIDKFKELYYNVDKV